MKKKECQKCQRYLIEGHGWHWITEHCSKKCYKRDHKFLTKRWKLWFKIKNYYFDIKYKNKKDDVPWELDL